MAHGPKETTDAVLIGRRGRLREEVAEHLGPATAVVSQPDDLDHLAELLLAERGNRPLTGTAAVLITQPFLPGLGTSIRYRSRSRTLTAKYASVATTVRDLGADLLVVCSSAFLYADDHGLPLRATSRTEAHGETVAAYAAERAAQHFSHLGGRSVVLRLGWVFGEADPITDRVTSAARKGWQLIQGNPGAWVAALSTADAAAAIAAAMAAPPGTYNIADDRPVTQGSVNAVLQQATGTLLHPLDDPGWGEDSTLFGASRRLETRSFTQLTGWRPSPSDLLGHLCKRIWGSP
jgi:hypothetical protein